MLSKERKEENWEKSVAQRTYYSSMKGRRGVQTPGWKGDKAGKSAFHKWLNVNFGRPNMCQGKGCSYKSKVFEWCLKREKQYSHNRGDYLWLCRSCHRKYDLTPEKKITGN